MKGLDKAPTSWHLAGAVIILTACALAGCAHHEKLAVASGSVFPLNPEHWQASPADLAAPDAGK